MLSIDGTHIENDLGLHLLQGSNEPILPDTQDNTVTIPGRHGAYSFDSYLAPRRFFQEVLIPTQSTIEDVQEIVRSISPLILDYEGKPKEVELRWDYEPDKYYIAKFSGYISINRIHHAGIFYLPFTAYDPHAHSIVTSDEITWGNEELTFQSHYLLGHEGSDGKKHITSPTTLTFEVVGQAIKPIIEISGSADDLTLSVNNQSFTLNDFNNVDWVIDGNKYLVTKNNANAFSEMEGDFLMLNRGQNELTVTGSNLDVEIHVKFRDKYL